MNVEAVKFTLRISSASMFMLWQQKSPLLNTVRGFWEQTYYISYIDSYIGKWFIMSDITD